MKYWRDEYADALLSLLESQRIAREHHLSMPLLYSLWEVGLALTGKGDYDAALATLEEDLVFSEKMGDEVVGYRLLNTVGRLYIECGALDRAIDLSQQAAEGARKVGDPETIANPELNLADCFLAQGDLALARSSSKASTALHTIRQPATGCDGAIRCTSLRVWESTGWRAVTSPRHGDLPAAAWTSPHAPLHGSIWSRDGDSKGRSLSLVASGTTRNIGCGRPRS
jgi:tetratricopeptide (TPR) repeat protein